MNNQSPNLNDTSEASLHAVDYWQVLRNRYGIIILATLLIFATAAIITYVIPPKYKSFSIIQIHNPQNGLDPLAGIGQTVQGVTGTKNFMNTQFALISSEVTLKQVAKELDLPSQWNVDEERAVGILKSIVKPEPIRGTDLVQIEVEHKDKDECKLIAQAVAYAYKKQREKRESESIDAQLAALDSELQIQEDKVQQRRNILTTIMQTSGMHYIANSNSNSQVGEQEASIYNRAVLRLEELEKDAQSLEIQIKTLTGQTDESLIATAAGLNIVQSRVPQLYEQLVASNRDLISFQDSGYGARHPKMLSARKTNEQLWKDVRVAVDELRQTLRSRLELVLADLEVQRGVVNKNQDDAVNSALDSHDYAEAKSNYEQEKAFYDNMKVQHSAQRIKIKIPKKTITMFEEAKTPNAPSFPNVKLNLALGAILGAIVGIGLAFFLEFIDTSVKSLDDVERYLQVPVLAVIPKDIAVLHKQGGTSPDAEAYRILRTNIEFNRRNPDDNCITVVSGGAGEGKSTTLVNLAYVCAQGGYSTLIVDADLRRPRLHTFFDINNSVGLTNYLTTDLMLEDVILQTPVENLYFMPSGLVPSDAAGILNSSRMSELINDVKQRFDLVLIDSPPILGVSDAAVISSEVDQTMIVIQHRKLPRAMLMRVKQAVENVGGDIIGVVLNNVDVRSDNQYQYYTSYYTYYSPTEDEDTSIQFQSRTKDEPAQQKKKSNAKELKVVASDDEDSLY